MKIGHSAIEIQLRDVGMTTLSFPKWLLGSPSIPPVTKTTGIELSSNYYGFLNYSMNPMDHNPWSWGDIWDVGGFLGRNLSSMEMTLCN